MKAFCCEAAPNGEAAGAPNAEGEAGGAPKGDAGAAPNTLGGLPNALLAVPNPPPPLPNPLENAMLVCKEQYDPKIPRAIFLTKKKDPSSAALAAPHERAGFARAETLQSLPTSSSGPGARLRRLTGSVSPVRVDSGGHTFDSSELTRTPHGPPLPNPGRAPERDSRDSRAKDLAPEFTRAPRAVACFATRLSRSRHRGAQDSRRPRHPTDE